MWTVTGASEPSTPDNRRFMCAVKDWPRWPEASEHAARLAHGCETPWDALRAYAVLVAQFPEYPHDRIHQVLSHHALSCGEHSQRWNTEIIHTGVRWVEARSRTLPDAAMPLVEYNVWRAPSWARKDDPHEVLGDQFSAESIRRAWESALDLYEFRRDRPPSKWFTGESESLHAFFRAAYPGFSDESYSATVDRWFFVLR